MLHEERWFEVGRCSLWRWEPRDGLRAVVEPSLPEIAFLSSLTCEQGPFLQPFLLWRHLPCFLFFCLFRSGKGDELKAFILAIKGQKEKWKLWLRSNHVPSIKERETCSTIHQLLQSVSGATLRWTSKHPQTFLFLIILSLKS